MLSVVKMLLKGEVGGCALNRHGNYIVVHRISWKNHGNVLLNFYGNPERSIFSIYGPLIFLSPAHVYLTEYEDLKSMLLLSHYLGSFARKPVFGS